MTTLQDLQFAGIHIIIKTMQMFRVHGLYYNTSHYITIHHVRIYLCKVIAIPVCVKCLQVTNSGSNKLEHHLKLSLYSDTPLALRLLQTRTPATS